MTPKAAISWSGGKDCCLAWLQARADGLPVRTFVTWCEMDGTSKSHALEPSLLSAQVARCGAAWLPVRVPPGRYAEMFAATLALLVEGGHSHLVFGDIDLQAHRDWLEPHCIRAGLRAVFPLWGRSRALLAEEVLARGIRACVVGVDDGRLDESLCGRDYDRAFLRDLPPGICPCGEDGEFHTFVYDAPGMTAPVPLERGARRRVANAAPLGPGTQTLQTLRLATGTGAV